MSNMNLPIDNSVIDSVRLVEGPPSTISSYASDEENDIASTISSLDHVAYRAAEIQRLYPRQVNASTSTAPVRDDCSSDSGTCEDDDMTAQQEEALDDLMSFSPTASTRKAGKTPAPPRLPAASSSLASPLLSTPYLWWRDSPDSAFRIHDVVPSLGLLCEWGLPRTELTALRRTHVRERITIILPVPKEEKAPPVPDDSTDPAGTEAPVAPAHRHYGSRWRNLTTTKDHPLYKVS